MMMMMISYYHSNFYYDYYYYYDHCYLNADAHAAGPWGLMFCFNHGFSYMVSCLPRFVWAKPFLYIFNLRLDSHRFV